MNDDRKIAATTGGAIGISALASFAGLCCIGPWAVVLFGVPGAVTLAQWAPVRPYVLVIAAGMLAWAFWRVYRPRSVRDGEACSARASGRIRAMLWLAAVILVLAFFAEQLQWLLVDPTPEGLRR